MAEGRIASFNSEKGHGFIAPDQGGPDLFVHGSSIETPSGRAPQEGQRVRFTVEQGADGPHAVKVTLVEERPPRTSADGSQQVRRAWLVVAVLAAPVLLVLVVAYALLAPSAGWWSPSWLPLVVGALIATAYAVGKLKS